ncbi:MAG: phosphoglycerate kinase [Patescibacteria group bacterium]
MKTIDQLNDIAGKKVLLRADFDVAVNADGTVREPFRIQRQRATIDFLLSRGARVLIAAHISAIPSFAAIAEQISTIVGQPLSVLKTLEDIPAFLAGNETIALLENIRTWPEEEKNDDAFAATLAHGFDYYVNNAFAACHREHASVVAIARHLPSYAGLLVEEEVATLDEVIRAPAAGKVVIMGGAKASTKIPVIKYLLDKAESVLVGGVIANDMAKALGRDVGSSVVDENYAELLAGLDLADARLVIPEDFVIADGKFLDIGARSTEQFLSSIGKARTVVWNGPLGMFEDERFRMATSRVAQAIVDSGAGSIIGGGDTITALDTSGLLDKFGFVSTGGGAMLMFLAGEKLPGLEVLGYYT